MSSLKYSIYNSTLIYGNKYILYNVASDGLLVVHPELYQLLKTHKQDIETISQIHPEFYEKLSDCGMIVSKDKDESADIIAKWKEEDNSPQKYTITINPTMDCNLRCWYCYEKHCIASKMDEKTIQKIQVLIKKKADEGKIRGLNLDFFGGEPLLYFKETVIPILRFAQDLCTRNNIQLYISFTTNGILLTEDVINELKKHPSVRLQITLDGDETLHNETRKTIDGQATYQTIIKHIKDCAQAGFTVLVRMNYTHKNAYSFTNVISQFKSCSTEQRKHLLFDFHRVWQESSNEQTESTINEIKEWFNQEKFSIEHPTIERKGRCYADKENNIVINYNGDLYKCTAQDFSFENREGYINENGELVWNDKYTRRMNVKYGNKTCRECILYPLCHGGCSQSILKFNGKGCLKGYSKEEKERILKNRILHLFQKIDKPS